MRFPFIRSVVVLMSLSACGGQAVNAASTSSREQAPRPVPKCGTTQKKDHICSIHPASIHPTQFAVGYHDVTGKRAKIAKIKTSESELERYLTKNTFQAIKGPSSIFYLIDGHHRSTALLAEGVDRIYIQIIKDKSNLNADHFWTEMRAERLTWPYDENGKGPLDPRLIPVSLKDLKDDPYRSIAEDAMDRTCYQKTEVPFQQFIWANFYRARISRETLDKDWKAAVQQACAASGLPEAKDLPGYSPKR